MKKNKVSINIISSFNHANFVSLLKNSSNFDWEVNEVNYNQVFQTLTNSNAKMWKQRSNVTLIWTTPESISSEFQKLQNKNEANSDIIKKDVDYFCSCIRSIKKYSDIVLVPNWILKQPNETSLAFAYSKGFGLEYNLSFMNYYLSEQLNKEKNLYILNSSKWLLNCGASSAYSSKLWYLTKTPFSNNFFKQVISDLSNLYGSIKGLSKKLLILDLDDTLWGGIVGEVGWKNLRIGGHDHLGEAFRDFQIQIKSLKNQGIILALASKNDEVTAIKAINNHPEMILSMEDFVTHRINWEDKAKNIIDIVNELNLGLQSVVFLDDSPFERARVQEALPEVLVPELPKDPTDYNTFLSKLRCFDKTHVTDEDKSRSNLYKSESKRIKLKQQLKSLSDWIKTLNLTIVIENIKNENTPRAVQLFNKTNQMNLSTRRLSEQEFNHWVKVDSNNLWTIRAADKFGDYGIIGILSISTKNNIATLVDFILSCRVVGRYIEETMIEFLKEFCQENNVNKIKGKYKKTDKNSLCYNFLNKLQLIDNNQYSFEFPSNKKKLNLLNITVKKPTYKEKINVSKNIMAK
jgi:FkbH-like protein